MEQQAPVEGPVLRNTVTLVLDGSDEEVLLSYRASIAHLRGWNRQNGIRVNVSAFFGNQRELYTTPTRGTFYFVVRYQGRYLVFVIHGRTRWLVGYVGINGLFEMISDEQSTHYMASNYTRWLNFKGNHRYISGSDPGATPIGPHPLRNAFDSVWPYDGETPEPENFRRSIGVFEVHICEVKCQHIFLRICSSFTDPSVNRLRDSAAPGMQIECFIESWSFLCSEAMYYVDCLVQNTAVPAINNRGIELISTAEDILWAIRILYVDSFFEGVFAHEPSPAPPRFWEPVDAGEGDVVDIPYFQDNNDNDDESDDDDCKKKRRRWERKEKKQRRTQIRTFEAKIIRGIPGGTPAEIPPGILANWLQVTPTGSCFREVPEMQTLSQIKFWAITDEGLNQISPGRLLAESINSSYFTEVTDSWLAPASRCSNLNVLAARACVVSWTDEPYQVTPSTGSWFTRDLKLQTVRVDGSQIIVDELEPTRSFSALRESSLIKCLDMSGADTSSVLSRLKNLRKLGLTCNRIMIDVLLAAITSPCLSPTSLRVECCACSSSQCLQMTRKRYCNLKELVDCDLDDAEITDILLMPPSKCNAQAERAVFYHGQSEPHQVEKESPTFGISLKIYLNNEDLPH